MNNEVKEFPGAQEARKLLEAMGFKNDKIGCEYFGLHQFYIRNTTIHTTPGTEGKEKGVDIPEYILKTMRSAFKLYSKTNGNLLFLCPNLPKKLDYDTVIKFINKKGFSEKSIKKFGVLDKRTFKWAYRYVEVTDFLRKEEDEENEIIDVALKKHYSTYKLPKPDNDIDENLFKEEAQKIKERVIEKAKAEYSKKYPLLKTLDHKEYLKKIGISVFWYSFLTKIPYPSLAKQAVLPYQLKLAELMYLYMMHVGSKIDVNKPFDINFAEIFWKNKVETLYKKERLWYKLTGKHVKKKTATEEEIKKMDIETECQKEELKELDEILSFNHEEFNSILAEEGITELQIMEVANCEHKRLIWRGRVLAWSICFARLLRQCINKNVAFQ